MGWFFRVVELDSGAGWACRFGRKQYDTHAELGAAVEHITTLAADWSPAELVVHRLDGSAEHVGVL